MSNIFHNKHFVPIIVNVTMITLVVIYFTIKHKSLVARINNLEKVVQEQGQLLSQIIEVLNVKNNQMPAQMPAQMYFQSQMPQPVPVQTQAPKQPNFQPQKIKQLSTQPQVQKQMPPEIVIPKQTQVEVHDDLELDELDSELDNEICEELNDLSKEENEDMVELDTELKTG